MTRTSTNFSMVCAIAFAAMSLGSCATNTEMDALREEVTQARIAAENAQAEAAAAQAKAEQAAQEAAAASEKADRIYQQSLRK